MNENWTEGNRAAWLSMLRTACRELGYGDDIVSRAAGLAIQLEETRAALREVCRDHGSNEWPDDLHLADVVDKHLRRPLEARELDRRAGRDRRRK